MKIKLFYSKFNLEFITDHFDGGLSRFVYQRAPGERMFPDLDQLKEVPKPPTKFGKPEFDFVARYKPEKAEDQKNILEKARNLLFICQLGPQKGKIETGKKTSLKPLGLTDDEHDVHVQLNDGIKKLGEAVRALSADSNNNAKKTAAENAAKEVQTQVAKVKNLYTLGTDEYLFISGEVPLHYTKSPKSLNMLLAWAKIALKEKTAGKSVATVQELMKLTRLLEYSLSGRLYEKRPGETDKTILSEKERKELPADAFDSSSYQKYYGDGKNESNSNIAKLLIQKFIDAGIPVPKTAPPLAGKGNKMRKPLSTAEKIVLRAKRTADLAKKGMSPRQIKEILEEEGLL